MQKTQNYQLNQYEPQDSFLRTNFNEDNTKIDAALAEKIGAVTGYCQGTGEYERIFNLGFHPLAVLYENRDGTRGSYLFGGLAVRGSMATDNGTIEITEAGFRVTGTYLNSSNCTYHYIAFR